MEAPRGGAPPERPPRARGTLRSDHGARGHGRRGRAAHHLVALITAQHGCCSRPWMPRSSSGPMSSTSRCDVRRWPPGLETTADGRRLANRRSDGRSSKRASSWRVHRPYADRTIPPTRTPSGPPVLDDEAFPYRLLVRDRRGEGLALILVAGTSRTSSPAPAPSPSCWLSPSLSWERARDPRLGACRSDLRPVEDIRATVAGIGAPSLDRARSATARR